MGAIDVAVPQRFALVKGIGQGSLAILAQRQIHGRGSGRRFLHRLFNSFANLFSGAGWQPVAERAILAQQAQQQVFGFDVGSAEPAGFKASEEHHAARLFTVAFKHAESLHPSMLRQLGIGIVSRDYR